MGDWSDEWGCWDVEDFILESVRQVEWRLENLDNYIHYDINGKKVDIRKIDDRYAKNLFNWFNKHLKEAKEELDEFRYNRNTLQFHNLATVLDYVLKGGGPIV
jgi:hypothetical protein